MPSSHRFFRRARACVAASCAFLALGASAAPQASLSFPSAGVKLGAPVTLTIGLSETGGLPIAGGTLTLSYPNFRNTGVTSTTCAGAVVVALAGTSTLTGTAISVPTSSFCQVTVELQPQVSGTQLVSAPAGVAFANGAGLFNTGTSAASICVEAPYVVTSTADAGPGSLRQAITDANAPQCVSGLTADIKFNIPVAAAPVVQTVQPLSPLPAITRGEGVNLDAYTQSGAARNTSPLGSGSSANLMVILNGSACTPTCVGLHFASPFGTSSVQGLAIHSFNSHAIFVTGGTVAITGNYIGTDPGGNNAFTSAKGIVVAGGTANIGDGSNAGINLISGNLTGIEVSGQVSVLTNQVGGTRGGLPGLANGIGIAISAGSGNVTGNLVRFNTGPGIQVDIPNSPVDLDGNLSYGNGGPGIDVLGDGPSLNDTILPFDQDGIQNYPEITLVQHAGGNTIVSGVIHTLVGADSGGLMQLFSNPTLPPGGRTEGQNLIDSRAMPALDASGFGSFTFTIAGLHDFVSGTLVAGGGTRRSSEYSPPVQAVLATSSVVASPGSLAFGPQAPSVVSAPQQVSVTNTNISLVYNVTSVTSSNPAFSVSHLCSTLTPGGGTCFIQVTFTGPTAGNYSGTLNIATTDPAATLIQVPLTGTVGAGTLTFAPGALNFGNQVQATASAPQVVRMTNTSATVPVAISSIAAGGDFSVSHFCGASLGPNTACDLNVTFTPSVVGPVSGALTVTSDSASSPDTVALQGTGVAPAGTLLVSPTGLVFGLQAVGSTSPTQAVTLTNTGRGALTIASIVATPSDFGVANGCPASLAPSASCTLAVAFTPAVAGAIGGSLTITSGSASSPDIVSLAGTGGTPPGVASVAPATLAFAVQAVGTTSPPQTVTLTNTGAGPLTVSGVTASGDYAATSACPASLAPTASCTISVTFTPTAAGGRTGSVSIASSSANSPTLVALNGSGFVAAPIITVVPATLTFGARTVNTASPVQTVTVQNSGTGAATLTSVAVSGDFQATSLCGASLAPAATCTIDVKFLPLVPGTRVGQLTILSNAPGSPHGVALSGSGLAAPVATLDVAPATVDFGTLAPGSTSPAQLVSILNSGQAVASFSVTVSGPPFALVPVPASVTACGGSLNPGAACSVALVYAPTATGSSGGTLLVTSDASNPNVSVPLSGTAAITTPTRSLSLATRMEFGTRPLGLTTPGNPLAITNTTGATVALSEVTATGDFAVSDGCTTIAPRSTCTLLVTFTPTARGPRAGLLTLRTTTEATPYGVDLAGDGGANPTPVLSVSPARIGFGNALVGPPAGSTSIDLANIGEVPVVLAGFSVPGDFLVTNRCPGTLAVGQRCQMDVSFFPRVLGLRAGLLDVLSNAGNGPHRVEVSGVGCALPGFARNRLPQLNCTP